MIHILFDSQQALVKLLQLVRTDLDRERKSRIGLRGLTQTLNTQENQNVTDKLYHVRNRLEFSIHLKCYLEFIKYHFVLISTDSIDANLFGRGTVQIAISLVGIGSQTKRITSTCTTYTDYARSHWFAAKHFESSTLAEEFGGGESKRRHRSVEWHRGQH